MSKADAQASSVAAAIACKLIHGGHIRLLGSVSGAGDDSLPDSCTAVCGRCGTESVIVPMHPCMDKNGQIWPFHV